MGDNNGLSEVSEENGGAEVETEEEEEDGAKPAQKADGEAKPPPYGPGGNPQDPSRGPPPPYPGQQKVRRKLAWVW